MLPEAPAALSAADIRAMRKRLNASQAVFARCLNVSAQLVRAWEADRRHPDGAALRLLDIGRREPAIVFPALVSSGTKLSQGKNVRRGARRRVARSRAASTSREALR